MRVIYHWVSRCSFIVLLLSSFPASAHLVFTYTSDELPLTSYSVNGVLQDLGDYDDVPPVAFSFSFTADEQDLSLNPNSGLKRLIFPWFPRKGLSTFRWIFFLPVRGAG